MFIIIVFDKVLQRSSSVSSQDFYCSLTGEGGWFVIFRIFKSILFFVNLISLYFFHLLQNISLFCLLLLYFG